MRQSSRPSSRRLLAIVAALSVASCDDPAPQVVEREIPKSEPAPDRGDVVGATSEERFIDALRMNAEARTESPTAAESVREMLEFAVPTGWKELPPAQFRDVNLAGGPNGEVECYLTYVPGGGAKMNIDRWRKQFGLPEATTAEIAALPRAQLFGRPSYLVELTGTMTAMSAPPQADYAMIGYYAEFPQFAMSVKATGPKAVLAAEKANVDLFARSLRFKALGEAARPAEPAVAEPAEPAAEPAKPEAGDSAPFDPQKVKWTAPPGWTVGTGSSMRLVTLEVSGAQCWVTPLSGAAGGLRANLDRWRGELGVAKLTDDEFAKLPTLKILGVESPWLDLRGTYQGMGGPTNLPKDGARVLAAACALPDALVTVKMVGPIDVLERERENFQAFCRSLQVAP